MAYRPTMTANEMEQVVIMIQWELEKLKIALGPIRNELGRLAAREWQERRDQQPGQLRMFG